MPKCSLPCIDSRTQVAHAICALWTLLWMAGCSCDVALPSDPTRDASSDANDAAIRDDSSSDANDAAIRIDASNLDVGGTDASSLDVATENISALDAAGDGRDAGFPDTTHDSNFADVAADNGNDAAEVGRTGAWGEGFLLPAPDGRDSYAQFGSSVAISADGARIAVGDLGSSQVSVYEPDGVGWRLAHVVTADGATSSFGWDVDLDSDGTTLVVAAPPAAAVFVFERNNDGTWGTPTVLRANGNPPGFATAVAVSSNGRRVVVGAATAQPSQGVFVFERTNDTWGAGVPLTLPSGSVEAGSVVAIDAAGVLIVSGDSGRSSRVGSAAVYDRLATEFGSPVSLPVPSMAQIFAFDVAISPDGSTIAVGDSFFGNGVVSIYRRATNTWTLDTISAPAFSTQFGYALALDSPGTSFWSGDVGGGGGGGQVTEHVQAANAWHYASTLPTPAGTRDFGFAIDVAANGLVLVATDINGGANDMGTAYVFRR